MGILDRLRRKNPQEAHDRTKIYMGDGKDGEPVYWDLTTEHNSFFVGDDKDRYNVLVNVKIFVRECGLAWDHIEIYTPSHKELRTNSEQTPQKIKFLLEDLNALRADIKRRWEGENPSSQSLLLIINQASLFSMDKEEWERKYPLIPYKASRLLQLKLEEITQKAKNHPLHILLLDDEFENYGYIVEGYNMDFGIEADENGYLHKVDLIPPHG